MKKMILLTLVVGFLLNFGVQNVAAQKDTEGWVSLFNGKNLENWKFSDKAGSFSVKDGMIVVNGERSHLYYEGPVQNHNFTNFGLGFSLKLGFFQLYMMSDNIFAPIIWNRYSWTETRDGGEIVDNKITVPSNWKYMNFHFGMNFVFGCKPPKDYVPIID